MNDPVAMCREGVFQSIKGDYSSAFELHTKAAELGELWKRITNYHLCTIWGIVLRRIGERKFIYLEEAAIGGHPYARYDLGYDAKEYDISERAVRHWIISAILGDDVNQSADGCIEGRICQQRGP